MRPPSGRFSVATRPPWAAYFSATSTPLNFECGVLARPPLTARRLCSHYPQSLSLWEQPELLELDVG